MAIVGIDLGTTNSRIATMSGEYPSVIPNQEGERTTESVVAFQEDGTTLIGTRARNQFVKEQMKRADKYNVPYNCHTVNFLDLSYRINHYEMLLEEAKELGIYWEISDYDPVALEQEIENHKESERRSRDHMYSDYLHSRRVAV